MANGRRALWKAGHLHSKCPLHWRSLRDETFCDGREIRMTENMLLSVGLIVITEPPTVLATDQFGSDISGRSTKGGQFVICLKCVSLESELSYIWLQIYHSKRLSFFLKTHLAERTILVPEIPTLHPMAFSTYQSEVDDFGSERFIQKNVLWLEVAMHYSAPVAIVNGGNNLRLG